MAQTNTDRLIELGMVPALAQELTTQIANAIESKAQIAALVSLTDNSGGTATNTIADTPTSYTEATIANSIASLAGKVNAVIAALKA